MKKKERASKMIVPKISVIMPVYNTKEEFFRQAIESICTQTYKDFELIIVDDFSKPEIKSIVDSYQDKRIKYFRLKKNQGAAMARNKAIDMAKSEYIAFLDSDDIALKDRLEKQAQFLDQNPQIGCLATATQIIGSDLKGLDFTVYDTHFEIESRLIFKGNVFCQSSVMLRRSILEKYHIRYKKEYVPAEDYAFWLDLIGHVQFKILPEVLTVYRSHLQNISHRQLNLQIQKSISAQESAFEKYCQICPKDQILWKKYLRAEPLESHDLEELMICLKSVIKVLKAKGYQEDQLMQFFKNKFRKHYRKTRTLHGQWCLFHSKLNAFFKLRLGWRMFYFITRGIL